MYIFYLYKLVIIGMKILVKCFYKGMGVLIRLFVDNLFGRMNM